MNCASEQAPQMKQYSQPNYERLKFIYLTIAFFFIIASYTITRELKDSIFTYMVGKEYLPLAKYAAMAVLIPAILLYSWLVDHMRRATLLCFYSGFYAIASLVFAYFLAHPTIGLQNTQADPYRIFGWLFYFLIEGYQPFVVSVFWAFANSVTSPESAKHNYAYMVSGSKFGGMVSAAIAYWVLNCQWEATHCLSVDIWNHQLLLWISAFMVCAVPLAIYMLVKKVPGSYLHGYEAVYQVDRKLEKKESMGIFSGLKLLYEYPYVMGMFAMIFFYEMIAQVLNFMRLGIAQHNAANISQVSAVLYQMIFATHAAGFLIALVGTRFLLERIGERRCLVLIPVISGVLLTAYLLNPTSSAVFIAVIVILRAMNYGFSYPVRETLYIPTIKEIKFKSKSWIDAFGSKFAKAGGQSFNFLAARLAPAFFLPSLVLFFGSIIGLWTIAAMLLGRRFDRAVSRNEVIGAESQR